MFDILKEHQLFVKESKCSFAQQSMEYLGHIISDKGVSTDPAKTAAMLDWPTPTNVTELRGFLGLTGYYRKFVQNYGLLAKPLTLLLKKQSFQSDTAETAFQLLKQAMATTPVLALPDFSKTFTIETDACNTGIGAVLTQAGHPIAYYSKALGVNSQKVSIYEKEFLAIMMAIDRWRSYLLRAPFVIKTDHQSLCHLGDQNLTSDLQRKAMTKLVGLDFSIQYKRGVENTAADALSRVAHLFTVQAMSASRPVWVQEILNSYTVDPAAQEMLTKLAIDVEACPGFQLQEGLIRQEGKIWVGANAGLQTKLIQAFHSTPIGGHSGMLSTYHKVKQLFSWTGLKKDVQNFVKQCNVCQQAKHELCRVPGLLQPLPIPDGPWQAISMDFIEGLPRSEGFNAILVVVDRFTKMGHFLPLKHPFTAASVAKVFLNTVVRLHGLPLFIVSDRDKIFTGAFWKELFRVWGTELQLSTAYHPQTDGQTERVNQCLEMYLRCAVHDSPTKWASWLPQAEFWYNTTYHSSLGCTPYKALYGYEPHVGQLYDQTQSHNTEVQNWLSAHTEHTVALKE